MYRKLTITLHERGSPFIIQQSAWKKYGCFHDAVELEQLGVIRIIRTETYLVIQPSTLVGTFVSPTLCLKIQPKSPELANFLFAKLDQWRKKTESYDVEKPIQFEEGQSLSGTFEHLLSNLLREGIPWLYSSIVQQTSRPRGRILFKDSYIKLASHGINHKVISKAQVRSSFDLFASALEVVRRKIFSLENIPYCIQSKILRLIEIVGDIPNPIKEAEAIEVFQSLKALEGRPALFTLCEFCTNILSGDTRYKIVKQVGIGIAEFIDMEKLWESAVKMFLEQQSYLCSQEIILHPLRKKSHSLFKDGGPIIDPDIIGYDKGVKSIVVDAKYSKTTKANASDIYQISSYAARLSCKLGILVYLNLNDKSNLEKIGTLNNGIQIFAYFLNVDAFDSNTTAFDQLLPPSFLSK